MKKTTCKKEEVFVPASCSVAVINIHKTATRKKCTYSMMCEYFVYFSTSCKMPKWERKAK